MSDARARKGGAATTAVARVVENVGLATVLKTQRSGCIAISPPCSAGLNTTVSVEAVGGSSVGRICARLVATTTVVGVHSDVDLTTVGRIIVAIAVNVGITLKSACAAYASGRGIGPALAGVSACAAMRSRIVEIGLTTIGVNTVAVRPSDRAVVDHTQATVTPSDTMGWIAVVVAKAAVGGTRGDVSLTA